MEKSDHAALPLLPLVQPPHLTSTSPARPQHAVAAAIQSSLPARLRCCCSPTACIASPERLAALCGCLCLIGLYRLWPAPSTVLVYLAGVVALGAWLIIESVVFAWAWRQRKSSPQWSWRRRLLALATLALCTCLFLQGARLPEGPPLPPLVLEGPLLVTVVLHDSSSLLPHLVHHLARFVDYAGRERILLSIVESSRSEDSTLTEFDRLIANSGSTWPEMRVVGINRTDEHSYWIDTHSRDHIRRRSHARNVALAPLADGLQGKAFAKILSLDAVYFDWTDLVRLLGSNNGVFEMACGLAWDGQGLSDTWSLRDQCGVRARPAYPYLQHGNVQLDKGQLIDVASCWSGVAAYTADPFLSANAGALRQAMVQERREAVLGIGSRADPGMASVPLAFHPTTVEECAASEGMLLSYDYHLLSRPVRPRVFVNPLVNVAEHRNWYLLYRYVLQRPFVRPWVHLWDRWLAPRLLAKVRAWGRPAELCQWQGFILPEGCPLPEATALGLVA